MGEGKSRLKKEWDAYFNEDELSFDQVDLPIFSVGDSLATKHRVAKHSQPWQIVLKYSRWFC